MGRNAFPPIGELPYFLTLAAHGFFWMLLSDSAPPPSWHAIHESMYATRSPMYLRMTSTVKSWSAIENGLCGSWSAAWRICFSHSSRRSCRPCTSSLARASLRPATYLSYQPGTAITIE